jgi:hypothetical protein
VRVNATLTVNVPRKRSPVGDRRVRVRKNVLSNRVENRFLPYLFDVASLFATYGRRSFKLYLPFHCPSGSLLSSHPALAANRVAPFSVTQSRRNARWPLSAHDV